ncbi:MAG: CHAT domain-containing protein [Phaeodactylibacter sp.]|nr:CHAT domain-containing protein [Phaeodactylibacter sp.]
MPKTPPVALILFSNDLDSFLPNVERERKMIEEALEAYNDTNRLKVIARSSVSIDEIFRLFNRYQGRISVFHFAGHAGGAGLQLNKDFSDTEAGHAGGLADLFRREVEDGILQLVFLNGCSTLPQLEGLKAAGVPSVIATRCPIEDDKALHLANQFYRTLAGADQAQPFEQPATIGQAFDRAMAYLKTAGEVKVEKKNRDFVLEFPQGGDFSLNQEPWTLYAQNEDWALSYEVAEENKPFNEFLTRQLIEALPAYSKPAQKFLEKADAIPDWESVVRVSDKAKDILAYSFVGVLGIHLRKLFAIGKEPNSEDKQRRYLANTILTAQRTLKLLSFALLSQLWDRQKGQPVALTEAQCQSLRAFFEDEFGLDTTGNLQLLTALMHIFRDHQIEWPMPEQESLLPQLEAESGLVAACTRLKELRVALDKAQFTLADCFAAERQLTYLLEKLAFLAAYRMVSIKNITYNEMRNAPPRYLHSYTVLGIDSKRNVNTERVNYVDAPISTQAVLLFKGRYQQSINLFPFLIDVNALTDEVGAKVCFYSHQDLADGSLHYQFMEDNSYENIAYQNTWNEGDDMNQLMLDPNCRRAYNLDSVFLQFQEAKKVLLGADDAEDFDVMDDETDDVDF